MFKLLETVALTHDIHAAGLRRGDLGSIVELHAADSMEVEFVAASGRTLALLTLGTRDPALGGRPGPDCGQITRRKRRLILGRPVGAIFLASCLWAPRPVAALSAAAEPDAQGLETGCACHGCERGSDSLKRGNNVHSCPVVRRRYPISVSVPPQNRPTQTTPVLPHGPQPCSSRAR